MYIVHDVNGILYTCNACACHEGRMEKEREGGRREREREGGGGEREREKERNFFTCPGALMWYQQKCAVSGNTD